LKIFSRFSTFALFDLEATDDIAYPKQNHQCAAGVKAYQQQLVSNDPEVSGFQAVTLEECIEAMRAVGDGDSADTLHGRYLDFQRMEQAIFG